MSENPVKNTLFCMAIQDKNTSACTTVIIQLIALIATACIGSNGIYTNVLTAMA